VLPKALNSKLHTIRQHFIDVHIILDASRMFHSDRSVRDTGDILELEVIVEVVASKVHVKGNLKEVLRFCTRPARSAFSSPSSGAGGSRT